MTQYKPVLTMRIGYLGLKYAKKTIWHAFNPKASTLFATAGLLTYSLFESLPIPKFRNSGKGDQKVNRAYSSGYCFRFSRNSLLSHKKDDFQVHRCPAKVQNFYKFQSYFQYKNRNPLTISLCKFAPLLKGFLFPMNTTDNEIYFHVGLGKTATTWLQYKFFPKLKGIKYIHRHKYIKYRFVDIIKKSAENRFLISREFDRQLEEEVTKFHTYFPNAKTIIVLRRHDQWIASQYRRAIKNGSSESFSDFFNPETNQSNWKINDLLFFPKIQFLENKFGSKPLVLFHEELKESPFNFLDKIVNFMHASYSSDEIDLNAYHSSYTEKQLKVIYSISPFIFDQDFIYSKKYLAKKIQRHLRMSLRYLVLYTALLVPEKWIPKKPLIDPEELKQVKEYFADDWQKCIDYAANC